MFASKAFYILQTPAARRGRERLYTRATNDRHVTETPIGCTELKVERKRKRRVWKARRYIQGRFEWEGEKRAADGTDSFCLCQTRQATKGKVVESASNEFWRKLLVQIKQRKQGANKGHCKNAGWKLRGGGGRTSTLEGLNERKMAQQKKKKWVVPYWPRKGTDEGSCEPRVFIVHYSTTRAELGGENRNRRWERDEWTWVR